MRVQCSDPTFNICLHNSVVCGLYDYFQKKTLFIIHCTIIVHVSNSLNPYQSKKDIKDQESIQSSTTPVPGYQMVK